MQTDNPALELTPCTYAACPNTKPHHYHYLCMVENAFPGFPHGYAKDIVEEVEGDNCRWCRVSCPAARGKEAVTAAELANALAQAGAAAAPAAAPAAAAAAGKKPPRSGKPRARTRGATPDPPPASTARSTSAEDSDGDGDEDDEPAAKRAVPAGGVQRGRRKSASTGAATAAGASGAL